MADEKALSNFKSNDRQQANSNPVEPLVMLPCPFCGCAMVLDKVGRDWWRIKPEVWHNDDCPIDNKDFDYSLSCSKQEVIDIWNQRAS